jgi:hypothetical protein
MTQRQNIFGFLLLSAIFVGWLVYSESKSSDSEKYTAANEPKDSDGDGVLDEKDQCPNEAGEINFFGCPDGDTDRDGVNDKMEAKQGTDPKNMDTDDDGVDDNSDFCPNDKGIKENKGCPKKEPATSPVFDFDENKKVEIKYNGDTYTIKQGFISENGMLYNKMKWRFYNGKWQKQEIHNSSGKWMKISEADINQVLINCANKKKTNSGGKGNSGESDLPPSPPAGKVTTEADYQVLKNLYNEILLRSDLGEKLTKSDLQLWKKYYAEITNGKSIAEAHINITRWNMFILNCMH